MASSKDYVTKRVKFMHPNILRGRQDILIKTLQSDESYLHLGSHATSTK